MFELLSNAPATLALLIITVGVSMVAFNNGKFAEFAILVPHKMWTRHEYHQLITSGFLHGDTSHLFVNMLTLFFFGPYMELYVVGSEFFLVIYFVSLITGNLYPFFKYRKNPEYGALGASGAVSGIVFAFCLVNPLQMLYIFFAIPMPAFIYAILWVGYSVYSMKRRNDNIGHEAHLAGALGGIIAMLIMFPEVLSHFFSQF